MKKPDFYFCIDTGVLNAKSLMSEGGKMKKLFSFDRVWTVMFLSIISLLGFNSLSSLGQTNPNEALWSDNGYSIKKVVSNTTIASGVNFSYTIIFSAPAGVTSVSIQDLVPSTLQVVSVTAAGPVCSVVPTLGTAVNTVTYNLTGLSPSCAPSGSFTIVVKFPEGTTCNGTPARNRAEMLVNGKWQATPYISTTATAVDPWVVSKSIVSGAVVNPNGGNCGYLMNLGATVTYRLSVTKANGYYGNVIGQQNMSNATVTDVFPTGAVFVSSPCATYNAGTGTITWNVNPMSQLLDAANPWAYYWCDVTVTYPAGSFPINTQVLNQATLTGVTCNQQATHQSNQTCITVANIQPNPNAFFGKYLALTNRVPGCSGYYYIAFCNNGNVPLTAFNINDAVPGGISVNQVQIYGANGTSTMNLNVNSLPYATGISNSYSSPTITGPVTNLQFQMTGTLPVGACLYMYVYFTVSPNPTGTIVNNCATFAPLSNTLTLPQACVQFTVDAGAPNPCLLKDICSPKASYDPGDIVRFRLRVQNIGSANLTGAMIQDALHSNFTYVGNETYYVANTYNPPCSSGGSPPSGATAWTGVSPAHSGNNLSWNLPTIPSDCQLFYTAYCGYYGTWGLPYYYIEFDAKVDSFALPGVTPNFYNISGGNLSSITTSNTVNILVVASFGQEVEKLLSTDAGANYASSGTAAPGSTARYRLNYKNTSNVGVSSVRLIDLLGRDDIPNNKDWLIFNRSIQRGSQFDVSYIGNHATSLLPSAPATPATLQWATGDNICLPPYVVPGTCNPVTWGGTPDRNISMDYGAFILVPNKNLREDFDVGIPTTAHNLQKVCNDFAAIATAGFLLNGSPQSVALTPVAAPPVCLTIDSTKVTATCCDSIQVTRAPGAQGTIGCCANITTTCPVKAIKVTVSNGTLSSASWNCTAAIPAGYVGQNSYTFAPAGCTLSMNTCVDATVTGPVVITYDVEFTNGEKCQKKITLDCTGNPPSCCDSIRVIPVFNSDGTKSCCAKLITKCKVKAIDVTITNGTLSSTSWNCATPIPTGYVGQSTYTFAPNGCVVEMVNCVNPVQTGTVIISYTIYFENGEKCTKDFDLDCTATSATCCDSVKVEPVINAAGVQECCVRLSATCKVKLVDVTVVNGTINSTSWNCGPLPVGYVGQSNFSFTPNGCIIDMTNCFKPDQNGVVAVSYLIYFENGEKCEKSIKLDCVVPEPTCCDSVRVEPIVNADGTTDCCAKLTTKCKVKAIDVTVSNGYLSSASWNCVTPIPTGYVGQSSFTFAPNGCKVDLVTCVNPKQSGIVVINYVIYFENGEKCEKKIELDCNVSTVNCCDSVRVEPVINSNGVKDCCAKITTTCKVKAVDVSITNGTISSTSWNCGTLPSGYIGQSSFTFAPNGCVLEMINCVTPIKTGLVVISYVIYFENGEKCEKKIELDCAVKSCCDLVKLNPIDGDGCCADLVTECEVKSVNVQITNGTISSASWNCGTLPSGYIGQSNFTFPATNCAVDLKLCINPAQSGSVVINYAITFANGEKCEKSIKLNCNVSSSCCALAEFKLKPKWPFWKNQVGTFHITNADPSVPICYIEISPASSGIFSTSGLSVNGVTSSQAWNPTRVPASGNLTPSATNTVDFSLTGNNYNGKITICVIKCDGTRCCFEFNWVSTVLTDVSVGVDKDSGNTGLVAVSIRPVVNTPVDNKIKYISFGYSDEKEVSDDVSEFYAISATPHEGDEYPKGLANTVATYMGIHNAFFELSEPKSANEDLGLFNLVFTKKLPKLGCTLFDESGIIIFSDIINISGSDTVTSSLTMKSSGVTGDMFEFVNLYPNPSDGSFKITYATGTSRDVVIKLASSTGQILYSQASPERVAGIHNVNMEVNGLSAGLYKVVLISDGEIRSKSLIVK